VKHVGAKRQKQEGAARWRGVMTKVNMLATLSSQFDRLIWIDPDILVTRSLDHLCDMPSSTVFAAVKDGINGFIFNTGTAGASRVGQC
jgi:alpha-N-acetylglucosamine transferase